MTLDTRTGLARLLAVIAVCAVVVVAVTIEMAAPHRPAFDQLDNRLPDLIEDVRPAVVHVAKLGECQGSGCLISPDGIIFTAKHVSDGQPGDYEVTLDDGQKFKVKPGYVLEDKENDVTFMMLDLDGHEPNLPCATLAKEDVLRVGESVLIMGSPLGSDNFNSVSLGILSATGRDLYNRRGWESARRFSWHVMLQSTSPAFPGNSGGPVFNMAGEVIGVLVAGQAETLNFSVPVARFADTIDAVRTHFRLCRFNVVGEAESTDEYDVFYEMQLLRNAIDQLN